MPEATQTTVKFEGSDYRSLLDLLIEANVRVRTEEVKSLRVEIEGKVYDLLALAEFNNREVGYETPLSEAHDIN